MVWQTLEIDKGRRVNNLLFKCWFWLPVPFYSITMDRPLDSSQWRKKAIFLAIYKYISILVQYISTYKYNSPITFSPVPQLPFSFIFQKKWHFSSYKIPFFLLHDRPKHQPGTIFVNLLSIWMAEDTVSQ